MFALFLSAVLLGAGPKSDFQVLRVLYTSDVHCQTRPSPDFASAGLPRRLLGGWPGLDALVEQERTEASLLLDCGDFAFGSPDAESLQGRTAVQFMNKVGYDAAALGSADFAGGVANVEVLARAAGFPILADPMLDVVLHRQVPMFRPYIVKEVRGIRVGIVGITDPLVPLLNRREDAGGLVLDSPLQQVARCMPALSAESAEVVIVIGHIPPSQGLEIADGAAEVDLVICVGDGTAMESCLSPKNHVPIVRAGVFGQRLGEVDVLFHRRERTVYQVESRVLNVEPRESESGQEWQWFRDLVRPWQDTAVTTSSAEFAPDTAGRRQFAELLAEVVRDQAGASLAVIPAEGVEAGLGTGELGLFRLHSAAPYRNRLRLAVLPESLLPRLVAPPGLPPDWPAPAIAGADYFVATQETLIWPVAAQVVGPRLRKRTGPTCRVVATEQWLELTAISEIGELLPENLTEYWLDYAAAVETLPLPGAVRLLPAAATQLRPAPGALVNVNTASSELLQTLPGVGPKTAEKIIRYRETVGRFASVEDLLNVSGIGPKKLERLRPLVTVR